jgi:hypothetical protein
MCNETDMEFDLIGIYPPIANAFRRLLLSEVSLKYCNVLFYTGVQRLFDHPVHCLPLYTRVLFMGFLPQSIVAVTVCALLWLYVITLALQPFVTPFPYMTLLSCMKHWISLTHCGPVTRILVICVFAS